MMRTIEIIEGLKDLREHCEDMAKSYSGEENSWQTDVDTLNAAIEHIKGKAEDKVISKDEAIAWMEEQIDLATAIFEEAVLTEGVKNYLAPVSLNEMHVSDALKLANLADIPASIEENDNAEWPITVHFQYKGVDFFSQHKKGEVK